MPDLNFKERVVELVRFIPRGKVVSYGQIAACMGQPRAARQVGWALRATGGTDLPWWRVINNAGKISIKGNWENTPQIQRQLLEADGVKVSDNLEVEMAKYRYALKGLAD